MQEPVDGGGGQRLGHELVEPRRVQVRRDRDGTALVGGVDEAVEPFGGAGPTGSSPISSTITKSARRIRVIALVTESSARWRRTRTPRASRVNQATWRPASTAAWPSASSRNVLPVPAGPQTTRFSARPIHSRVRSAAWVGAGIEEVASFQAWKVFPVGNAARARPVANEERSRPATPANTAPVGPRRGPSAAPSRWPGLRGRRGGCAGAASAAAVPPARRPMVAGGGPGGHGWPRSPSSNAAIRSASAGQSMPPARGSGARRSDG